MPLQPSAPSPNEGFSDAVVCDHANAGSAVLRANTITPLTCQKLVVGCGWDRKQDEKGQSSGIDLDASVVCFDAQGQFFDCIYFGNLCNPNKSIIHAGDNRTGAGEGDDEEIVIQLDTIPPQIAIMAIVINSYSGDTFESVHSAFVRIINSDRGRELEMGRFSLSASGNYTAMIMAKIYRNASNQWVFHPIGKGTQGRSFGASLPAIQAELRDLIPNIQIAPPGQIVVMTKGESVAVVTKDNAVVDQITLGLGWDMIGDSPVDLDASCVMFSNSNRMVDVVYFNHLTSNCGSILHQGDNRSGAGDGDDEKIFVNLARIPAHINALFFIVNCFSAHKFALIKNAYVRICQSHDRINPPELMRFSLSTATGPVSNSTAMIMCKLYRQQGSGRWMCKALGYGTTGRTYDENVPEMQKELAGRLPVQPNGFQWIPPPNQVQAQAPPRNQAQPKAPPPNADVCCIIS